MPSLSESEQQALLQLARDAVLEAVCHGRLLDKIPCEGIFAERRRAFVTLRVDGRLHGCIGVTEANETLAESIVRCAVSAALRDNRFPPLSRWELDTLQIEISLLSPPVLITPERIVIGEHGLLVARGNRRGVLLPQVAVKHGFSRERFLVETCRKAELGLDAWREPDTHVFAFTTEFFSEPVQSPRIFNLR
jgi:AmmeMemoRadiSam system protein A